MSARTAQPSRLAFPVEEYAGRVERVQRWLADNDVDCALITQPEHYCWLSGYEPTSIFYHQALVVPGEVGAPLTLLYNKAEEVLAEETSWVEDKESVWTAEDQVARTVALLRRRGFRGAGRLGMSLSSYNLKPSFVIALGEALPEAELVDVSPAIDELRLVKSPLEVRYLEEAARIADVGISAGIETAREGVTDSDVLGAIQQAVTTNGGEFCAYPGIVDARASLHGTAIGKRLDPGDVLLLEVTGVARRYHCNEVRNVSIGDPPQRVVELYELVEEAHRGGIELLRPGFSSREIVEFSKHALGEYGGDNWGRFGFGMELSYPPIWLGALSLIDGDEHVLEAGIVLTLETGILAAEGSLLLGTNVHVTEKGPVVLNQPPTKLFVR